MNNLNIPIYRAKKIDSDEYVEGFYKNVLYFKDKHIITSLVNISGVENNIQKTNLWDYKNHEIDQSTLAIHFPDMLDSQGNKIFASLSASGKGGDITELQASSGTCLSCGDKLPKTLAVAIYEEMEFREIELNPHKCFRKREHNYVLIGNLEYKKVIGIQK